MKALGAGKTDIAELLLKKDSKKVDEQVNRVPPELLLKQVNEATPVTPALGIACCLRLLDKRLYAAILFLHSLSVITSVRPHWGAYGLP